MPQKQNFLLNRLEPEVLARLAPNPSSSTWGNTRCWPRPINVRCTFRIPEFIRVSSSLSAAARSRLPAQLHQGECVNCIKRS
jgi:hypothetical protein